MTIKLTLKSGVLLLTALLLMMAGIAYGVTVISRGVEGFVRVTAEISVDEALALYQVSGDQPGAPLTRIDFGTMDLDPFGNVSQPEIVTVWAENGSGSAYWLIVDDQYTGDDAIDTFGIGEVVFARRWEPLSTMPSPDIVMAPGDLIAIDIGLEFSDLVTGDHNFTVRFRAEEGAPPPPEAHVVTKTGDTNDGVCDADCSIREAIAVAIPHETIHIPPGTYTLALALYDEGLPGPDALTINKSLVIQGSGPNLTIIQAGVSEGPRGNNWKTRIFNIAEGDVTISGMTIRHGYVPGQGYTGIQIEAGGGGIINSGSLTLIEVVVTSNWAATGGGGIKNSGDGTLNIINSVVTNNSVHSTGDGGGIASGAGSTLIITNSAVSGNTARNGGGIVTEAGSTLIVTTSAVTGNTANYGGGIYAIGTADLTNSTISGNTARRFARTDGVGGGIWVSGSRPVNVTNSTISHNHAILGGGIASAGLINSADLNLTNTIVANPSGGDCHGSFTSLGHNLDSDGSCSFQATGDISDVNPALGSLQDNGGPTFTHALLPGSPAIDHIPAENCEVDTDQRGIARPQGTRCDIGAYELEP